MKGCKHPIGALIVCPKDDKIYCKICGRSVRRVRGGPKPHGIH